MPEVSDLTLSVGANREGCRTCSATSVKKYGAESHTVKGGGAAEGGADDWGEVVTR